MILCEQQRKSKLIYGVIPQVLEYRTEAKLINEKTICLLMWYQTKICYILSLHRSYIFFLEKEKTYFSLKFLNGW